MEKTSKLLINCEINKQKLLYLMDQRWNLTLDIKNLEEKADTHNFAHPTGGLNETETERQMFFICSK